MGGTPFWGSGLPFMYLRRPLATEKRGHFHIPDHGWKCYLTLSYSFLRSSNLCQGVKLLGEKMDTVEQDELSS